MKENKLFKGVAMLATTVSVMGTTIPAFANEATIGEVEVSESTNKHLTQLKDELTSAKNDLEKLSNETKSLKEAYDKINTDSETTSDTVKNAQDKTKLEKEKLEKMGFSEEEINKDAGELFQNTSTGELLGHTDSTVVNYKLEAAKAQLRLENASTEVEKAKARYDKASADENNKRQEVETKEKEYNTAVDEAKKEAQSIKVNYNTSEYSPVTTNLTYSTGDYISAGAPVSSVPSGFNINTPIDTSNYTSATYPWGQCTWYVFNRAAQLGISFSPTMGNGGDWRFKEGYTVNNTPEVGDALSFAPGQAGAAAFYGHVAFVEDVKPDGSILISESNVQGLGVVSYRTFDGATAKQFSYVKGQR